MRMHEEDLEPADGDIGGLPAAPAASAADTTVLQRLRLHLPRPRAGKQVEPPVHLPLLPHLHAPLVAALSFSAMPVIFSARVFNNVDRRRRGGHLCPKARKKDGLYLGIG